ncbi:LacI family DNA-binding transcriptional regulator [Metabacillus indicus]|uniref:LacI family DNA-binding transcriptional regulator n=1 Tax=Metabacillus indicus TaxID=246786 RepID=UPI0004936C27|nr:LacI family DNA-binding transcriptional regulator [Metabacillus indicus]KEZ48181.1 alanine racemase [Metabacillus indicus LMG 22858]
MTTKITIKDVAREAGVSISTVSNALNGVDVLNAATREHVLNVANRLNYIPNVNGRNLKTSATKVLGLFITSMQGPYYGILTDAVYKECERNGYELNVFVTKNDRSALSSILGKRVDGAIILNDYITDKNVEQLEQAKAPVVFLDREQVSGAMSSVVFDSYKGGQVVARYLMNLGHKRLGYIQGYSNLYDDIERFRGFRDAIMEAGLEFHEDHRLVGYFEEEASYSAVKSYVRNGKRLPDAFFAANDLSAIGAIKALKSEGLVVPDDISVIGFDDIDISGFFNPPITTVNNPIARQGLLAVNRLLAMIQKKDTGRLDKLEGTLVVRNSCSVNKMVFMND